MSAPEPPQLRNSWITGEEAERRKKELLRNDPVYRAQVEAVEAERRERVRKLREAEQPIIKDLRDVGIEVGSVWDLVNTSAPYLPALPVLMKHLERDGYPDRVVESIGRALAVRESVPYWHRLRDLYLRAEGRGARSGLAVALGVSATPAQLEELIELLHNESLGESRVLLIAPVIKLGGARGREVIKALRDHPVLGKEATFRARRWK
ncbi:hypothetical protein [uncultured Microbacterium sp.]|uniref:hypothetical protein n=1 Tax=uncultured Microbacterium sp. TaxID=191216 RepID=UPI0025E090C5|nr:hypothetical protein [uncultured Microbacterium sp.]